MSIEKILAAVGAMLALLAGVFFKGRSDGKKDVKREYDTAVAKQRAEASEKVKEVRNETASSSDDDIADKLKRDWVRK